MNIGEEVVGSYLQYIKNCEFIQKNFVKGRSYELTDWLAGCTGVLIALLFIWRKYIQQPRNQIAL